MTTADRITNVVLVHGAFADGSGWRRVHDLLTARGFRVSIVQNPLTSLDADVAATTRVLDQQDGPAILVGHSWGGTVITQAGTHDKVAGLVYVSALIPDVGETSAQQYEGFAATPEFVIDVREDGASSGHVPAALDPSIDAIAHGDALQRAIDRLSVDQRTILALHHLEERPVAEIAAVFGIPVGTAKWRLHEARAALQRAMETQR